MLALPAGANLGLFGSRHGQTRPGGDLLLSAPYSLSAQTALIGDENCAAEIAPAAAPRSTALLNPKLLRSRWRRPSEKPLIMASTPRDVSDVLKPACVASASVSRNFFVPMAL